MEIHLLENENGLVRLETSGKITFQMSEDGKEPLSMLCGDGIFNRKALLDLRLSNLIDSSGVGWLLSVHKRFEAAGGKLILHSLSPMSAHAMRTMRVHMVLNLAQDESSAREKAFADGEDEKHESTSNVQAPPEDDDGKPDASEEHLTENGENAEGNDFRSH